MEIIAIAFHLVSFLLAVLAAALLLWVNQERKHSNRLLAFILLLFAGQNLIHILLFSRLILSAPWLLRAFAPTTFLLGPVVFIYVRSVLKDEIKFRKYDWLLLIPGILAIINFIPYYILPEIEKLNYLNDNFYSQKPSQDSGRGILPTTIYYIIRVCWSGIFLFLTFRMISRFKGEKTSEFLSNNKILLNWLFTFNCILASAWMVTLFQIFSPGLNNILPRINNVLFGATIFFICLQLFVRPQILYGIFQPLHNIKSGEMKTPSQDIIMHQNIAEPDSRELLQIEPAESALHISQADQLRYKTLIEKFFKEETPFLQTSYSLEHMANDTQIPRYLLSAIINREYGMGFREFLNRYRVDYLSLIHI